jgi:hypothetical protein
VRLARKATNLSTICEPTVWIMCDPQHLTTLYASTACYRDSFTFLLYFNNRIVVVYCVTTKDVAEGCHLRGLLTLSKVTPFLSHST